MTAILIANYYHTNNLGCVISELSQQQQKYFKKMHNKYLESIYKYPVIHTVPLN